ncbi:hypothetical protein AOLI_G00233550 [Acnodon oligacanthus]
MKGSLPLGPDDSRESHQEGRGQTVKTGEEDLSRFLGTVPRSYLLWGRRCPSVAAALLLLPSLASLGRVRGSGPALILVLTYRASETEPQASGRTAVLISPVSALTAAPFACAGDSRLSGGDLQTFPSFDTAVLSMDEAAK